MTELFQLSAEIAICCNPNGRFHGWLFRKHPDGQWVSVRKLDLVTEPFGIFGLIKNEEKP